MNPNLKINLAIQPDFNCPKCKCMHFHQVVRFKIVPGLLVGAPTTQLQPMPVFICVNCGYEFVTEDADIQLKAKSAGNPAFTLLQKGGES